MRFNDTSAECGARSAESESTLDIREANGDNQSLKPAASRRSEERGVRLVPITGAGQAERLRMVSAWDGHPNMLLPTHAVVKGEESDIVGCTSLGACVFAHTWLHTEKLRGFDMKRAQRDIETVARNVGWRGMCVVAPPSSPMFKHLAGLGYQDLGDLRIWAKFLQGNGTNGT